MTMTATSSVPASNLRRLIVVVRPSVMHVVMPPANHSVTNYMVTWVMILDATSGDPTSTTRTPLVAAVRIVKQRVLVRLRIRVKVVVDLGLQLLGDGRSGCCCCRRRGTSGRGWYSAADWTGAVAARHGDRGRYCRCRGRSGRGLKQWRRCNVGASWRLSDRGD